MCSLAGAALAAVALLSAGTVAAQSAPDLAEIRRFHQASFHEGRCDGWEPVATALLAVPQSQRTQETPYVLASAGICAAKAGRMDLAQDLGLKMLPDKLDKPDDYLISVPLGRYITQVGDMPEGAEVVLRVLARNKVIVGLYPGDLETRREAFKLAEIRALYRVGRVKEAADQIETGALAFQMERGFAASWLAPDRAASANRAILEQFLGENEGSDDSSDFLRYADAALSLGHPALAITAARRQRPEGADWRDNSWAYWNARVTLVLAHAQAGRVDAAIEAYEEAASTTPADRANGHRTRALAIVAMTLIKADRSAEALALMDKVKTHPPEEDGNAIWLIRACANSQSPKPTTEPLEGQLRASPLDINSLDAMVCAFEPDAIAKLVARRLDSPDLRASTLLALQTYLEPPPLGRTDTELRTRRAALLARADLRAAVDRRGRILSTGLYRGL